MAEEMTDMSNLEWVTNATNLEYSLLRLYVRARPQATEKHTVKELEEMGLFGYYKFKEKS